MESNAVDDCMFKATVCILSHVEVSCPDVCIARCIAYGSPSLYLIRLSSSDSFVRSAMASNAIE